ELRGYWPASDTHFQTSRENFRNCFTTRLTPNARPRLPFESARRTERQWHATHWSACSGNEKTVTSSGARPEKRYNVRHSRLPNRSCPDPVSSRARGAFVDTDKHTSGHLSHERYAWPAPS